MIELQNTRVLCYCAVNLKRRFPEAEATIRQIEGVTNLMFDERDDPAKPWYANVLKKYRYARWLTLAGNYDGLLLAESDMLIPSNALERLARLDAPVAYGLYCLRHGVAYWNVCVALEETAGAFLSDQLVRENAPAEWESAKNGAPTQAYGVGFGCTLIRRDVLEQIDFRNFEDAESFFVDWLFAADCNRLGIRQMCDPQVVCGHIADTGVLYPDLNQPEFFRQEVRDGKLCKHDGAE